MKAVLILLVLFAGSATFGQSAALKEAVAKLDQSLIQKDTATVKGLLHNEVTYGHSSGWVQTKQDILNDLASGKLTYTKLESSDYKWIEKENWATVRSTTRAGVILNDKAAELNLHVLEVWIKEGKRWQLIARQSTKL